MLVHTIHINYFLSFPRTHRRHKPRIKQQAQPSYIYLNCSCQTLAFQNKDQFDIPFKNTGYVCWIKMKQIYVLLQNVNIASYQ